MSLSSLSGITSDSSHRSSEFASRIGPTCRVPTQRHKCPAAHSNSFAAGINKSSPPTARAVIMWNFRPCSARANSSSLLPSTWIGPMAQAFAASFKKALFLATGSKSTISNSGAINLRARPGNPAPLPISRRRPRNSTIRETRKLSPKCLVIHSSGAEIAVRLILRFQRRRRST